MTFDVYAGCAGAELRAWHPDCQAPSTNMAIDIEAAEGTEVYFRVKNLNEEISLKVRYKYDCAWSYVRGQVSTILVLVEDVARGVNSLHDAESVRKPRLDPRNYVFRYVHVVPNASVANSLSAINWVSPGQTRAFLLGTLSDATLKADPPLNPPGDTRTWGQRCPGLAAVPDSRGKTDNAGHCSTTPHLHQAASNGLDRCLAIDINGNCFSSNPLDLTVPRRNVVYETITESTVIFDTV